MSKHNNRHFGGIAILINPLLKPHVKILKNTYHDYQGIVLDKKFFNLSQNLYICVVYDPPEGSSYSQNLQYDVL